MTNIRRDKAFIGISLQRPHPSISLKLNETKNGKDNAKFVNFNLKHKTYRWRSPVFVGQTTSSETELAKRKRADKQTSKNSHNQMQPNHTAPIQPNENKEHKNQNTDHQVKLIKNYFPEMVGSDSRQNKGRKNSNKDRRLEKRCFSFNFRSRGLSERKKMSEYL